MEALLKKKIREKKEKKHSSFRQRRVHMAALPLIHGEAEGSENTYSENWND